MVAEENPSETLATLASRVAGAVGYSASQREAVAEELLEHLTDAYESEVARGAPQADAADWARTQFGDPRRIVRRLVWQRIKQDWLAARTLSGLVWWLALADVGAAIVWSGFELVPRHDEVLRRAYVMGLVSTIVSFEYWWSLVLARFAVRAIVSTARDGAPPTVGVLGLGAFGTAAALLVICRPGATTMIACGADVYGGTCSWLWYPIGMWSMAVAIVAVGALAARSR